MQFMDESSLYKTVADAATFLFGGGSFTAQERASLAAWILTRQNRQRGFIFHPTPAEIAAGIRLLSGERPCTRLLAANAVELETLRLLALLQPDDARVQQLCAEADARLAPLCFAGVCTTGECAHTSIAVLRYRAARDFRGWSASFSHALEALKADRTGDGRWRRFPFYFTLLWLVELPAEMAHDELAFTADARRRLIRRSPRAGEPAAAIRGTLLRSS